MDTPVLTRNLGNLNINQFFEIKDDLELWSKTGWTTINEGCSIDSLNLFQMEEIPVNENENLDDLVSIKKAKCHGFFMKWGSGGSNWYIIHYDHSLLNRFKVYFQQIYQGEFDLITDNGYYILTPRKISDDEKLSYSKNKIPEFVLNGSKYIKLAFLNGYNSDEPFIPNSYKFKLNETLKSANIYYLLKSLGKRVNLSFNEDSILLLSKFN